MEIEPTAFQKIASRTLWPVAELQELLVMSRSYVGWHNDFISQSHYTVHYVK